MANSIKWASAYRLKSGLRPPPTMPPSPPKQKSNQTNAYTLVFTPPWPALPICGLLLCWKLASTSRFLVCAWMPFGGLPILGKQQASSSPQKATFGPEAKRYAESDPAGTRENSPSSTSNPIPNDNTTQLPTPGLRTGGHHTKRKMGN